MRSPTTFGVFIRAVTWVLLNAAVVAGCVMAVLVRIVNIDALTLVCF